VEIIDLRKYRRRRRAHMGGPRDTKIRGLQSQYAGKHDDNNWDNHKNLSRHNILGVRPAQHLNKRF
jgi:hypothetical protein